MSTLVIDPYRSHCMACGGDADPYEATHDRPMGYAQFSGCGVRYTHLATNYTDFEGLHERIRRMRPDLEWVGLA